jgi:hypothetical protein
MRTTWVLIVVLSAALGAWFVQTQSQPQSELNLYQLAKMPPPPATAGKLVQYAMDVAGGGDAMPNGLPFPFERPLFMRFDVHIHNKGNKAVLVRLGKSAVECAGHFVPAVTTMEDQDESDIGLLRRGYFKRDFELRPLETRDLHFRTCFDRSNIAAGTIRIFIQFSSDSESVILSQSQPHNFGWGM